MSLDSLALFLRDFAHFASVEIAARGPLEWCLFFMPLVLLFEFPRYYLPILGLLVARALGLPRRDRMAEQELIERLPLVSVVIAGRNEGATIEAAIRSLRDQDYPNLEIIVVDDASEDDMYEIVRPYARRREVRLIRNSARRGRAGRPSATNLGVRLANGEFVVSLDADTTFDRNMIRNMIAPFADPEVGVVAGSIGARNAEANLVTRFQAIEYALGLDLRKRWTDLFGNTLQASGAIGAFRRHAVMEIGNWDPELAEDADMSLRMKKRGWKIRFAPLAVALTEVPFTWKGLTYQRLRWDRGGFRIYFKKHWRLLSPRTGGWGFAKEMWAELFSLVLSAVLFPFYLVWLAFQGAFLFLFVLGVSWVVYAGIACLSLGAVTLISHRFERPWTFLPAALLTPFYKEYFRLVRIRALVLEVLRIDYEDSYIPETAYAHAPRF